MTILQLRTGITSMHFNALVSCPRVFFARLVRLQCGQNLTNDSDE
jgi:hypothetical protein